MKTKEELTEDELKQVTGGIPSLLPPKTLQPDAYSGMFNDCPGLTPDSGLPAASTLGAYRPNTLPEGFKDVE